MEECVAVVDAMRARFPGLLPPRLLVRWDDSLPGDGQYRHDDKTILLHPSRVDSHNYVGVVAHECMHALCADAVEPGDEHGVFWREMCAALDPHCYPDSEWAAKSWVPSPPVVGDLLALAAARTGTRTRSAPRVLRMRARSTGRICDYSRPLGDQVFHVTRGQLVRSDHWSVACSPDMFEEMR
jgi:hypothetical protein